MESSSILNQACTESLHFQQHPPRQLTAYKFQNPLNQLARFLAWYLRARLVSSNLQTSWYPRHLTNLLLLLIMTETPLLYTHCCGFQKAKDLCNMVTIATKMFPEGLLLRTMPIWFAACSGVMRCLSQGFAGGQQIHHLALNRLAWFISYS